MRLSKIQRDSLKAKFSGLCAYCGYELNGAWHADHILPVLRNKTGCENPENNVIKNFNPACASCNISKNQMSIEVWRGWLQKHVESLNNNVNIYKISKRFGLVAETNIPVIFYFEKALG